MPKVGTTILAQARHRKVSRLGKPLATGNGPVIHTEIEMHQDEIAKRLGVSRQAISLSLERSLGKIRRALQKMESTDDFDHLRPDDAASFVLALRAAIAVRRTRGADRSTRFFYLVKPLKPAHQLRTAKHA